MSKLDLYKIWQTSISSVKFHQFFVKFFKIYKMWLNCLNLAKNIKFLQNAKLFFLVVFKQILVHLYHFWFNKFLKSTFALKQQIFAFFADTLAITHYVIYEKNRCFCMNIKNGVKKNRFAFRIVNLTQMLWKIVFPIFLPLYIKKKYTQNSFAWFAPVN